MLPKFRAPPHNTLESWHAPHVKRKRNQMRFHERHQIRTRTTQLMRKQQTRHKYCMDPVQQRRFRQRRPRQENQEHMAAHHIRLGTIGPRGPRNTTTSNWVSASDDEEEVYTSRDELNLQQSISQLQSREWHMPWAPKDVTTTNKLSESSLADTSLVPTETNGSVEAWRYISQGQRLQACIIPRTQNPKGRVTK